VLVSESVSTEGLRVVGGALEGNRITPCARMVFEYHLLYILLTTLRHLLITEAESNRMRR
jgi:hypothetical protein